MGRRARKRSEPHLPPVEKIELSSAHAGWRIAAAIVLLVVGAVALAHAVMGLFSAEKGWQQIEVSSSAGLNCGEDFVLLYDLGHGGMDPTAEKKALVSVYSEAAVKAYQLFTNDGAVEGVHNVWYINRHPNEIIDVDPALYGALERIQASGDRTLYLGPVCEYYDNIFYCQDGTQTAEFDPRQNADVRAYFAQCAAYANDPSEVDVELLGDGQIRLKVGEQYLAFAEEQCTESFIDFYWMKNAFLADYLTDALTQKGYTNGALSSFDGFSRNLSDGESMSLNIYDRAVLAGTMTYSGPLSIVQLRSYPANSQDYRRYFELPGGQIRSAYLDTEDGLCRTSLDDLTVCGRDSGCAEVLLETIPVYVADSFDRGALDALASKGMFSVFCEDGEILCGSPDVTITAGEGYSAATGRS